MKRDLAGFDEKYKKFDSIAESSMKEFMFRCDVQSDNEVLLALSMLMKNSALLQLSVNGKEDALSVLESLKKDITNMPVQ